MSAISVRERMTDDAKQAAASLSTTLNADVLLFNARVTRRNQEQMLKVMSARQRLENVLLVLLTEGGDPNAAYKIARLLQQWYKRFICFLPSYSKSAATIILMGAHELVVADDGELGPVDVQLSKKDTLAEYESGLTVLTALNSLHEKAYLAWEHFFLAMEEKSEGSITLKTAADVAATLTTGLFSPVYQQIDPLQLGEAARAMLIGNEYGKRLNRIARNMRPNALDKLVAEYPDHGFVIDRAEAETLFYRVREATPAELVLSKELGVFCDVEVGRKTAFIDFLNEPIPIQTTPPTNEEITQGANNAAIAGQIDQPGVGAEAPAQATGAGVPSNGQQAASRRV